MLVAALSALTLEELVERPAPAKSTRMTLKAATRATLSAHRVIWIVAIVVSCPQFCTQDSQREYTRDKRKPAHQDLTRPCTLR